MNFFSDSLTRLKRQLGVSKDQEVAEFLGMGKTAFSERKKRNSFPDRELRALALRRPELGIDVDYVLSGVTETQSMAQRDALHVAGGISAANEPAPLPNDQQMWLDCYLSWGLAMQRRELARALGLIDAVPEVTPGKSPGAGQIGGTYSQHASGDGSIQIGRMTRQPTPTPKRRR